VLNARDITERVRLGEQLTRQAFYDGLTSLPNRALFRDRLQQALARSGGNKRDQGRNAAIAVMRMAIAHGSISG